MQVLAFISGSSHLPLFRRVNGNGACEMGGRGVSVSADIDILAIVMQCGK